MTLISPLTHPTAIKSARELNPTFAIWQPTDANRLGVDPSGTRRVPPRHAAALVARNEPFPSGRNAAAVIFPLSEGDRSQQRRGAANDLPQERRAAVTTGDQALAFRAEAHTPAQRARVRLVRSRMACRTVSHRINFRRPGAGGRREFDARAEGDGEIRRVCVG